MAKLKMLQSGVRTMKTSTLRTVDLTSSTTRPRGRAWMKTRERIAEQQGYRCVDCNRAWIPSRDQVDHDTPSEQGGSDHESNLRLRCDDCHAAKTKREAAQRSTTWR